MFGVLEPNGSQACGICEMLCEVNGTQGLKPSHLSPDYGHVIEYSWVAIVKNIRFLLFFLFLGGEGI